MPHSLLYKYTHSYMRQGNYSQALRGKAARLFLMLHLGTQKLERGVVRPLLPHIIAIAMVKGCGVGVRELSDGLRLGRNCRCVGL